MIVPRPQGPPRILIVDDNPSIHRDFDLVLLDEERDSGLEAEERRLYGDEVQPAAAKPVYAVDHAFSGLEAIAKAQKAVAEGEPYQVAFVDIRMPGIDGVEAIERMWRVDGKMQMVICTAYSDYAWGDLARRLGPTDKLLVLKKPFDSIEVTQLASTLTEKWFLARQAALKLEEMELLVARRTQRMLELQSLPQADRKVPTQSGDTDERPVLLVAIQCPDIKETLRKELAGTCRIIESATGAEALRHAQESVPDVICTEGCLPQIDAVGLCTKLKADELTNHIPVLLLATNPGDSFPRRAIEAGADEAHAWPMTGAVLRQHIIHLLAGRLQSAPPISAAGCLHPREIAGTQEDAQFLRRVMEIVEKHLADYEFGVDALAQKAAMSRRQLFRKLKAVAGCTPHALIRALRLRRAAQLLKESRMTVTEITYAVGFSDLKHFRMVFREQFGVLPCDYASSTSAGTPAGNWHAIPRILAPETRDTGL